MVYFCCGLGGFCWLVLDIFLLIFFFEFFLLVFDFFVLFCYTIARFTCNMAEYQLENRQLYILCSQHSVLL